MFDDQPIPNQGGTPPSNLPVAEPTDMFADSDPTPGPVTAPPEVPTMQAQPEGPSVQQEAPVPLADTPPPIGTPPSAMQAGVLQPKQSVPVSQAVPTPAMPADAFTDPLGQPATQYIDSDMKGPVLSRGIAITGVIIVMLLIIGGGGWWIYTSFIRAPYPPDQLSGTAPIDATQEPAAPVVDVVEEPVVTGPVVTGSDATGTPDPSEFANDITREQQDSALLFGELIDDDEDQLENATEIDIGTNPQNWDTDGDGLSDGEEVLVWSTDPLSPDTDGDGYDDKVEITAGYDPLGPGRLFEIPSSTPAT